jgi:tRNA (guanosine-2'-O-)-methyltransferase
MKELLINFFSEHITEQRKRQFIKVLSERTRYISVVLEDIYQTQNASAVLRSCDCFGIQDVYIIENRNRFQVNPDIALGSANWLTIKKFNQSSDNTVEAINHLKGKGYRIVATSPDENSVDLADFDISKGKVALFFGTERDGLTGEVFNHIDECIKIPMLGFTQSFNISVSVALVLYELTWKMRELNLPYQLSDEESMDIELDWLRSSIRKSKLLEKEFYKRNSIREI